jgi:sugar/nucleoside kinase (ribokinase family)
VSNVGGAGSGPPLDVVCAGILVADVVVHPVDAMPQHDSLALVDRVELQAGGSALSTASALARLGLRSAAMGKVGTDAFGDFLLATLDERGVVSAGVVRDPGFPTSASVVLVSSDGARTFLHATGADADLSIDDLDRELVFSGRFLHLAGAGVLERLDGEPLAALLSEARERGITTSLDTTWDPTGRWRRIDPVLPHLDLMCPSLAEARAISGEEEPRRIAGWLRDRGVRQVAVTMGAEGCYAEGEGFAGLVEAPQVDAVDGTGAGDAFAAGLVYGRCAGWPFENAVRFASAAGALATTALGAFGGAGDLEATLSLAESVRLPSHIAG